MEQQQLAAQIDACIQLIEQMEQTPEANAVLAMQALDRLLQLLAIPSAGCDGQTDLVTQEDVQ